MSAILDTSTRILGGALRRGRESLRQRQLHKTAATEITDEQLRALPVMLTFTQGAFGGRERLANHAELQQRAEQLGAAVCFSREPTEGTLNQVHYVIARFRTMDPTGW
ncbi:Uncharacterised protein [Mycobacteroides abscessus subsp. abscessus]|uniref:hypothetical protein n=1 Tax=Mycobacteroides abscessus TaxID=36809 RepID=UPI0009277197|nr:hypothetical protein [Mycobacteroides abscessus]SIH35254.1 Uncharacterised protein [Mycobacteroides abscessus subsp. abscessus]